MFKDKPLIPITSEISVDSYLISSLSVMAFPELNKFMEVVDKLTEEAISEVYSSKNTFEKNYQLVEIKYFQLLWNLILEKGRDENYV